MTRAMAMPVVAAGFLVLLPIGVLLANGASARTNLTVTWPTNGWRKATPASVGVDKQSLESFDADVARGKYMLIDSFQVFRCGGRP